MSNLKLKIPSDVIKIHKAFKKNGKKLYVVGGAIRDAILGKSPKDFDLATDAKPEEVEKIAKDNGISSKPIGKSFGVVSLFINKVEYEIATFRKDIGKGRRPTSVDYTDIQGDVKRRDLTVNALFYDIDKKEIVDLVGGIADLKKKNIRTVGKAKERFDEDPLRKLRALRFWTRLGGTLDKELLDALQNDPSIKGVSGERIRDEFLKSIKSSKNTKEYMDMCDKIGFTSQILPNLKVSKPYPKTNDYILFLAWILRKNSPIVLGKILNQIKYTKKEVQEIVFLNTLQDFKPENITAYKKMQDKADNNRIITFGKMIGKDMNKFVKYKLSITFNDVPKDLKGPQIGLWMANKEKETYLNEGLKEMGITDFKSLFKKMPSELQKRVYNLKNFGQRLDKHPEGNVLKHTIMVVNRSIKDDDIDIAIAAMFHDIGKDETAGIHPKKGHITHFGHEKVSASLVKKYKKFIQDVGGNTANVFYIVKNHMRYKQLSDMRPVKQDKLKSFRAFDKLGKFSKHDRGGLDESTLKLRVPSDILKIQKGFKKNGKKLYVVGGAVRDAILGKSPKDFDLATDAKPDEVLKIAKDLGMKTVEVGKSFGVVMVGGHEIATFRKDIGKGRRPSSVDYTDIEGDVRRRDLTINALFYDIDRKEIVDLVGGIKDLQKKKIRTVGKAEERFDEDPLRKLRALRFQARLGGNLDKELLDALQKDPSLKGVSFERVRDEVIKSIKSAKDTKKYMELNDKIGFTSLIFPNLKISKPYIKDNDYILFLASLFKKNSPSVLGKQLNKLTYSNDEKNNIVFLVSLQHFKPEEIVVFKKLQEKTSLSDDQILKFGKLIGKDMKKFVNFNLSIGGKDVPSDIKGPEIGLWIKNKEKEKFMNEIEQLISDIDDKLVEMFLPNTKTPQQLIKENINESKLLQEGGAYGHMSHPFDTDINLTFGQLKDIVNRALEGTLEYTREKTDGQALAISWRDGRLVAARNKGHLKNKGENALDIKGVSDKFQGRGGLSDAYNYAMKDLSNAIKSLSDKQRDKVFKQGACFMNLEVIYPTSVNVIPYGQALLVFHGTMEYNDEGVAIGENGEAARILAGMIKQVNKDVQDNYTIQGPPVVKLPKSQDLSKKRSKYSSQISKLQKEFSLKDTDGVANYHQAWWEQWVDKNSPSTLDNKTKMGLVKRWAFMDKKFRLDKKNITDEKTLEWAKKTDKDDQKKISKQNLMKFEQIFLGLGAEVLEFTSSALTVNPDSAVRDMKKRIDQTIKDVKKSGDPKKIEKLKLELGRLNSIGGSNKIVPNEGIVFLYNGNTFKLTGTFASVNQILGIFF